MWKTFLYSTQRLQKSQTIMMHTKHFSKHWHKKEAVIFSDDSFFFIGFPAQSQQFGQFFFDDVRPQILWLKISL